MTPHEVPICKDYSGFVTQSTPGGTASSARLTFVDRKGDETDLLWAQKDFVREV